MRRVVLDPGVIVSGLLNPNGPPGRLLDAWIDGDLDLVVSPHLLEELEGVLSRPKFTSRLERSVVAELLRLLPDAAITAPDGPPIAACRDPDDDYLLTLAHSTGSVLVSGDKDLLAVEVEQVRVLSPAQAARRLGRRA